MNRPRILALLLIALMALPIIVNAQRKITPVNTAATATQPINENADDTARINARMRASMVHYHDENGNVVYVDTITGREWRDSTAIKAKKTINYPLLESLSVGIDLWNPLMRAFGQSYGLIGGIAQLSLHNRFMPVVEAGLGLAKNTPEDNNYTYKSPMSVYMKLGLDYNFLYNSTPDYQFLVGLRFGFSPFNYDLEDVTISSGYWQEDAHPQIPTMHCNATWWEFSLGLKVKLWGPISAGWSFRYHSIMHETQNVYGQPWYIPGYGNRSTSISGAFTIYYRIPLNKKAVNKVNFGDGNLNDSENMLYFQDPSGAQPNLLQIDAGLDAENPE